MVSWPDLGTRVTVRYRRQPGSVPPLTDAVGHLLAVHPAVRIQTKTGDVVEFSADDAVALRVLTDAPVRTSAIRALEGAAAKARAGDEHTWLEGWLLRIGSDATLAANSAVPLDVSAQLSSVPSIAAWYRRRGRTPWLAIPDRLLTLPRRLTGEHHERVLIRDLQPGPFTTAEPPEHAAVTDAPDGTRWLGLSLRQLSNDDVSARRCDALLDWGARRGATRSYVEIDDDDDVAAALASRLGFRLHHRRRYVEVRPGDWDTV
jgi:N-acetylglutamate synthase